MTEFAKQLLLVAFLAVAFVLMATWADNEIPALGCYYHGDYLPEAKCEQIGASK